MRSGPIDLTLGKKKWLSGLVECRFCGREVAGSIPSCYTKDFKNGTSCSSTWHSALRK